MLRGLVAALCFGSSSGQQAGNLKAENAPVINIQTCAGDGSCITEQVGITLDAQFRYLHDANGYKNCYNEGVWNTELCPDGATCAQNCAIDGVEDYAAAYGVMASDIGVSLRYVTANENGKNVGSRVYLMDGAERYKMFFLKNREFTFDVEASSIPCGLNGAVYFVPMDAAGGMGEGGNTAGARFGTGYCDAQCPKMKFINGFANLDKTAGSCCAELDIWEANSMDTQMAFHPCSGARMMCTGTDCGDTEKGERYLGYCDKDGCDVNPFRLGNRAFYGAGQTIDPAMPVTVVTQFITADGTDGGPLSEIKRLYMQNGQVLESPSSLSAGIEGSSVTDQFCQQLKQTFVTSRAEHNEAGDYDQFNLKGGMASLSAVLDQGLVLVLSLWDDDKTHMDWLDSVSPPSRPIDEPGVQRGLCPLNSGDPAETEVTNADATVSYYNIKVGMIGSTTGGAAPPVQQPDPGFQPAAPAFQQPDTGFQPPVDPGFQPQDPSFQPQWQPPPAAGGAGAGGCSPVFQQCGGNDWNGPVCCDPGCQCEADATGFYAQCKPPSPDAYTCSGQIDGALQRKFSAVAGAESTAGGSQSSRVGASSCLAGAAAAVFSAALIVAIRKKRQLNGDAERLQLLVGEESE